MVSALGQEIHVGHSDFTDSRDCPACASNGAPTICAARFDGPSLRPLLRARYGHHADRVRTARFEVAHCPDCDTLFQTRVGSPELLAALYDRWIPAGLNSVTTARFDWLASHPHQSRDGHDLMTAASLLRRPLHGLRVLDFGMGQGLWTRIAKALGCDSHGFDLSASRMALAARHGVVPVPRDHIPGGAFDFINAEQVFEHLPDPRETMGLLAAGLQPGALLRVSVPAQGKVREALARVGRGEATTLTDLDPVFPLEHITAFSEAGLTRLGEAAGLRTVRGGLADRLAFLRHRGALSLRAPRNTAKELARPFVRPRSLTVWFRRGH